MTRLACQKCGTSIHSDTARDNGGLCMPCIGRKSPRAEALTKLFAELPKSAEFQRLVAERMELQKRESELREDAPWFGKTGLDEAIERELPRYLRREFGESIFDEGSLKAADLRYLGGIEEDGMLVHYWLVTPSLVEGDGPSFAYVEVEADGSTCTGWGDRKAPSALYQQ